MAPASLSFGQELGGIAKCLHAEKPEDRIAACTDVIAAPKRNRDRLRALTARGNAFCSIDGRCAEAVMDFGAAVKVEPGIAGYHDNLARALRSAGRFEEAAAESDKAIALAPRLAFVYVGKAKALDGLGRSAEALATLERAMAITSDEGGLWEYKGRLLGKVRDFAGAYAAFGQALNLEPDRVSVYLSRAEVELAESKSDAARSDLDRSMTSGRGNSDLEARKTALRARLRPEPDQEHLPSERLSGKPDVVERAASMLKQMAPNGHSGALARPAPAADHAKFAAVDDRAPTDTAAPALKPTGPDADAGCNFFYWMPVQRCIEEYHTDNDPMPSCASNPHRWNDEFAANGAALVAQYPNVEWDHTKWHVLALQDRKDFQVPGREATAAAQSPAPNADPTTRQDSASNNSKNTTDQAVARSSSASGEIETCNAPAVLSVIQKLSEEGLKKQQFGLLLANIQEAHFEYVGIRQISFDPDAEHRVCAMDRKLMLTYDPHTQRSQERDSLPIEYQIDRQLDGDRGSYVTCKCD